MALRYTDREMRSTGDFMGNGLGHDLKRFSYGSVNQKIDADTRSCGAEVLGERRSRICSK